MKQASIEITYKRYPDAKGIKLEIEGFWDDGFCNGAFLHEGVDLRDALDLTADEPAIFAQADAAYRQYLADKRTDREIDEYKEEHAHVA